MINLLNNNLAYVICFALVLLVGLYFGIVWITRETVRDELKSIQLRRNKKRKHLLLKRQKELEYQKQNDSVNHRERAQSDLDSYVDPAEQYEGHQQEEYDDDQRQGSGYSGNRLDRSDISMRDIADGVR